MTEKESEKLKKVTLQVTGMTCSTCAVTLEKGLSETPGVKESFVNLANEKAVLEYDPSKIDLIKIKEVVSGLGYGVATRKSIFPVRGMMSATCVGHVEDALRRVPGVISTNVNLASEKATIEYVEGIGFEELKNAVADAGYELGAETETLEDVTTASRRETAKLQHRLIFSSRHFGRNNGNNVCTRPDEPFVCSVHHVGISHPRPVLGRSTLLPGCVGGSQTPNHRYEHTRCRRYLGRLPIQCCSSFLPREFSRGFRGE